MKKKNVDEYERPIKEEDEKNKNWKKILVK